MATGGMKKAVSIEVEAITEGAVKNIEKLAESTKKAREATQKLGDATGKVDGRVAAFDQALSRVGGTALPKAEAAMGKADKASRVLAVGLEQSKGGVIGVSQVATTAAAAFGPWGIAISVAGNALLGLVSSSNEAEKASRAFAKAQEEERKAVVETYKAIERKIYWEKQLARDQEKLTGPTTARIRELENEAAAARGYGEDTADVEREITKLMVASLRAQKTHRAGLETLAEGEARAAELEARAQELERRQELRDIEDQAAGERRGATKITVGGGGKAAASAKASAVDAEAEARNEFANRAATSQWDTLIEARDAGRKATKEQHDRDFQTLEEKFDLIQKQKAGGERRNADSAFADSMRGIEMNAARGGKDDPHQAEMLRISETLAAQEEYYGKLRTLTDDAGEKAAIDEDLKAARHAAELARIEEESSAREEAYGRQMAIAGKVGDSLGAVAAAYVQAGDWSAKGFRKAVGEFAKAEAISMGVVAIREGVLAIASAASLNFPQAAAHGIASGVAAAQALVLGGIAAGMGSGGSGAVKTKQVAGFTGSDFGPGAANEPAANEAPTVSNSQQDTVAVSSPDKFRAESNAFAGPPSGSHGGNNVYQFAPGSVMTLGAIDDQTATKLAQGLDKATKRKGRLVG